MDTTKKITDVFSTTPLQSGMLYYDLMHPGSPIYMQQYNFAVTGKVHLPQFIHAWIKALKTFPAMQTSFHWEGLSKPLQVIHKKVRYPLSCLDLRKLPAEEQNMRIKEATEQDRQSSFSLDTPPLIRITLFRLSDERFQMLLTLHHIITDGWSLGILFSEFFRIMNQKQQGLAISSKTAPSMKQYVEHIQTKDNVEAREWWKNYLNGAEAAPKLSPLEQVSSSKSNTVLREEISFTASETQELTSITQQLGITLNTLFQAAWGLTLATQTGRSDILFASCTASRPPEVDNIENIYGPLLNILPLRIKFDASSIRSWLCSLHDSLLSAISHGHLPLTELSRLCKIQGDGTFLNSMTVFENFSGGATPELPLNITSLSGFEQTSYPLTVLGYPEKKLKLAIIYDVALFKEKNIKKMLETMQKCMLHMVHTPEKSVRSLFSPPAEQLQHRSILSGEKRDFPPFNPWERFSRLASDKGSHTALVITNDQLQETNTVSYSRLYERSMAIAATLQQNSFKTGNIAAIQLERGLDAVASMLAVWLLRGTWVPLPLTYPQHMAERIQKTAGVHTLITRGKHRANNSQPDAAHCAVINLDEELSPDTELPVIDGSTTKNPACILYTSGSTGLPKGVALSHKALGNRLQWMWEAIPWQKNERAFAKTTMAFVDFVWELFGSLLAGIPTVIPTEKTAINTVALLESVERHDVTRLILTPSVLASAQDMNLITDHCRNLTVLTSSGEPLSVGLANAVLRDAPQLRLLNLYGSTEVMGDATWYEFSAADHALGVHTSATIGKPITNTQLAVLDENGTPVLLGEEGELAISGDSLAEGYHQDDTLTSQSFMPLPSTGTGESQRWFKTGDMARINKDSLVVCMGRKDRQLKIRGVRVESGEVAACMKEHSLVSDATVYAVTDNKGNNHLAAYIIPTPSHDETAPSGSKEPDHSLLAEILKAHAAERLTPPKIPEKFIFLTQWPTTVSKKIDFKKLPNPYKNITKELFILPQGQTETTLAAIWKQLLNAEDISREDNFFQIGGDSLSVTQLAFELRKVFERYIPFQHLYQVPLLKDMAAYLANPEEWEQGSTSPFFLNFPQDEIIQQDVRAADNFSPQDQTSPKPLKEGMQVLLTGAPGLISLWLLAQLLESKKYTVFCLEEHDHNTSVAPLESLRNRLKSAGCWKDEYSANLSIVSGRLGQERFGMPETDWQQLANSIDMVFHCGLHVNLAQSYDHLHLVNIDGTKEVIRFCCREKTKPLHYISSHAIIDTSNNTSDLIPVPEDSELTSYKGLPGGYILSRWVMERMIWRASQRGLPSAIYRYVPVGGDTVTHQCDHNEIYWRLVRLFCKTNIVPDYDRPVNIIPVNTAAKLVTTIAGDSLCYGHAFHICNPCSEPWSIWAEYLQKIGYPISVIDSEKWFHSITNMPEDKHDDNSRILLSFLGKTEKSSIHHLPYAMENTQRMMEKHGIEIPPLSFELFRRYWLVMHDHGGLPAPEEVRQ